MDDASKEHPPTLESRAGESTAALRNGIQACIQCGTCTASCPNAFAMDLTPRYMWRLLLMEREDEIFASKTFSLCSACYTCTLRCPRGLPLTETAGALKRIAAARNLPMHKSGVRFYQSFMSSVRRHGRVHETEFMTLYFLSMKNPVVAMRFTPLGMKLMGKGKLALEIPGLSKGKRPLGDVFQKAAEMEARR